MTGGNLTSHRRPSLTCELLLTMCLVVSMFAATWTDSR